MSALSVKITSQSPSTPPAALSKSPAAHPPLPAVASGFPWLPALGPWWLVDDGHRTGCKSQCFARRDLNHPTCDIKTNAWKSSLRKQHQQLYTIIWLCQMNSDEQCSNACGDHMWPWFPCMIRLCVSRSKSDFRSEREVVASSLHVKLTCA